MGVLVLVFRTGCFMGAGYDSDVTSIVYVHRYDRHANLSSNLHVYVPSMDQCTQQLFLITFRNTLFCVKRVSNSFCPSWCKSYHLLHDVSVPEMFLCKLKCVVVRKHLVWG